MTKSPTPSSKQVFGESESLTIVEAIPDVFLVLDTIGKILFINRNVEDVDRDAAVGQSIFDYVPEHDVSKLTKALRWVVESGEPTQFETQGLSKTNSQTWWSTRLGPVSPEGKVSSVVMISTDITRRKRIERLLEESERKNHLILNAIPDMILRLNRKGELIEYSIGKDRLNWPVIKPKIFLGRPISETLPHDFADVAHKTLELAFSTGETQILEYRYQDEDGTVFDYEGRCVSSGDNEVFVFIRDITELKRMEKEILEIGGRVQKQIGQDLHDGLSQSLTGIAFMAKGLEQKLRESEHQATEEAALIVKYVTDAITTTRNMARGLMPVELTENGLASALQELVVHAEVLYKQKCESLIDDSLIVEDETVATHVYRIAQEALNNAVKHAEANLIQIRFEKSKSKYLLEIKDDGKGFSANRDQKSSGFGLHSMKYRARLIGAILDIKSSKDQGTVVSCLF